MKIEKIYCLRCKSLNYFIDHSVIPPAVKTPDSNFAGIKMPEAKMPVVNMSAVKMPT